MHRPDLRIGSALLIALALAGCGSSSSASKSSPSQTPSADTASTSPTQTTPTATSTATSSDAVLPPELGIELTSPIPLKPIPARYTCDGAGISPPLKWSGVPPNTAELDLFVFTLPGTPRPIPNWAIAGLKPTLKALSAGQVPAGAVLGRNSLGKTGYSVCPPKGSKAAYLIHLYALPQRVPATPGFDPSSFRRKIQHMQLTEGLLEFSYSRH